MGIKHYIVCKDTTIKEVLKKLEKYRCRMVYVVEDDKLIGSVSEGDIRRFLLNDNDIKKAVFNIMNPNPIRFMENQEEQVEKQRKCNLSTPCGSTNEQHLCRHIR